MRAIIASRAQRHHGNENEAMQRYRAKLSGRHLPASSFTFASALSAGEG
jgi:hypothetical protein